MAHEFEPRAPGFRDMAPPIVIAPAIAALVFGIGTLSRYSALVALSGAAATVILIGWPIIFWMVDNGRRGPVARTIVGVVLGAVPFVAALGSGIVGLYIRSNDASYVRWVLDRGASVPYFGVTLWPRFFFLLTLGVVSGVAMMWTLKLGERR